MVQVKYFAGFNEEGRGMVESVLCDWFFEKTIKEELVLCCYKNGQRSPIRTIKSKDAVIIQSVFEGSEE